MIHVHTYMYIQHIIYMLIILIYIHHGKLNTGKHLMVTLTCCVLIAIESGKYIQFHSNYTE